MNEKPEQRRPFQLSLTLLLLLIALIASLLATWKVRQGGYDSRPSDSEKITTGMTRNEVAQIMGEHDTGDLHRWVYRIGHDDYLQVWITIEVIFENGRVKEVTRSLEEYSHDVRDRSVPY
jgi:hypothetical protein